MARNDIVRRPWHASGRCQPNLRNAWDGSPLFSHPQNYKEDAGLQQMQALIAWGSGGMEGLGSSNGRQKCSICRTRTRISFFQLLAKSSVCGSVCS
mgnify:CR=1 FL=1